MVSPNYSSVVMSALGYIQPPDSRIVQAKKPFDWMTDDQFHNLQVSACVCLPLQTFSGLGNPVLCSVWFDDECLRGLVLEICALEFLNGDFQYSEF